MNNESTVVAKVQPNGSRFYGFLRRSSEKYWEFHDKYIWPVASLSFEWMQYLQLKRMFRNTESKSGLEIGSGPVPWYLLYKKKGEMLVITDIHHGSLKKSKMLYKTLTLGKANGIAYVVADRNNLPFREGTFDRVVSVNLTKTIDVRETKRVTRNGNAPVHLRFFVPLRKLEYDSEDN